MTERRRLVPHDRRNQLLDLGAASIALAGWLSFVRTVTIEWLARQSFSRDELRDLCLRTLTSALEDVTRG